MGEWMVLRKQVEAKRRKLKLDDATLAARLGLSTSTTKARLGKKIAPSTSIVSKLRDFLTEDPARTTAQLSSPEAERLRIWQALQPELERSIAVRGLSDEVVAGAWGLTPQRLDQLRTGRAIVTDEQLLRVERWIERHPPMTPEQALRERLAERRRTAHLTTTTLAEQAGVDVEVFDAVLAGKTVAPVALDRLTSWLDGGAAAA